MQRNGKPGSREIQSGHCCIIAVALLLSRSMAWAISELWYDEVVTLSDFVLGQRSLVGVFRSYPVANNHILFSAVSWLWIRFLDFNLSEHVLRLPSLILAVCTVLMVILGWQKWLGRRMACLAGITLAVCPVFTGFAYQFRGYSLSMFLAAVALHGVFEITEGRRSVGLWLHGFCSFLLPLVIPTNVFVVVAYGAYVWAVTGRLKVWRRLGLSAMVVLPGVLGASYYISILDQVQRVAAQTSGWDSRWALIGNLLLSCLAHGGVFSVAFLYIVLRRKRGVTARDSARFEHALLLLVCCAVPIAFMILSPSRAPYPRVFLTFLPAISFSLFRVLSAFPGIMRMNFFAKIGLIVINGFVWERGCTLLTERQVAGGAHPQNLLQQYYRGSLDLRGLAGEMARRHLGPQVMVMTDPYDFPTFRFYWMRYELPPASVFTERADMLRVWHGMHASGTHSLWVVARDEVQAAKLFSAAGMEGRFEPVVTVGGRTAYCGTMTGHDGAVDGGDPGQSASLGDADGEHVFWYARR